MPASNPHPSLFKPFAALFRALRGLPWLVIRVAAICLLALKVSAQVEPFPLAAELREARILAGVDPERARHELARLRTEALRIHALPARLEADEIECRMMTDIDSRLALQLAEAGVQAVEGSKPTGATQLYLMRLQTCIANVMADDDRHVRALASLEAMIQQTTDRRELLPARGLALLERGVYRSRRGELITGQQDLQAACEILRVQGEPRDLDLCMGHLANHYQRMGALDEAMQYLQQLTDSVRARGALFDLGIYTFSLAQVHGKRGEWALAQQHYQEALSLAPFAHDPANAAYAEAGMADVQLRTGQLREAEQHFRTALPLFERLSETRQVVRTKLGLARVKALQRDPASALRLLAEAEKTVRDYADPVQLSQWLEVAAEARAANEDWRGAYDALKRFREVDEGIQAQKLSDQSARLRAQFNREKDARDLASLRQLNDRGQQLRQTQAVALILFVLLLVVTLAYTVHKFRQAQRLESLALSDELTGLPNRRAVLRRAEAMRESAARNTQPLSVLLVDVDHFKRINDTHGHGVGDEVLRHLARHLPAGLRSRDCLGRVGGEEFMAVLPNTTEPQAQAVAERMRGAIESAAASTSAGTLAISVSIGVASSDATLQPITELMRRADEALYAAKAAGRNRVACAGSLALPTPAGDAPAGAATVAPAIGAPDEATSAVATAATVHTNGADTRWLAQGA